MSEESGFYLKMACNFILGNFDYEDPNNLFPMKNDTRKLMRTCRQCWVSYDINASSGACCFHRSFFRVTVPEARLGLVIGKNGSHLKDIREKSRVSNLSIPKDEGGKSLGEVHLQGKGNQVQQALAMITKKLKGFGAVAGSWDCCRQKKAMVGGCANESQHDQVARYCFLDKAKVVGTEDKRWDNHVGKVFALDCEMVNTTRGKELAWVTLLDFNGNLCYDTLVKPHAFVVDYNTVYSGVTEEMLHRVTTRLEDVQRNLLERLASDDILIGHSIDADLRALHLEHRMVRQLCLSFC